MRWHPGEHALVVPAGDEVDPGRIIHGFDGEHRRLRGGGLGIVEVAEAVVAVDAFQSMWQPGEGGQRCGGRLRVDVRDAQGRGQGQSCVALVVSAGNAQRNGITTGITLEVGVAVDLVACQSRLASSVVVFAAMPIHVVGLDVGGDRDRRRPAWGTGGCIIGGAKPPQHRAGEFKDHGVGIACRVDRRQQRATDIASEHRGEPRMRRGHGVSSPRSSTCRRCR